MTIPEVFPENAGGVIPFIDVTGLSRSVRTSCSAFNISITRSRDNFSWQPRQSRLQVGRPGHLRAEERERGEPQPGHFPFVATTGGATAFQNFLRGNAGGSAPRCSYTEAEPDIDLNLRFNRFEFYAQDSWRPTSRLTVDYGVRYSLYPPLTDENNQLVTFDPSRYNAAQAPPFSPTPPAR